MVDFVSLSKCSFVVQPFFDAKDRLLPTGILQTVPEPLGNACLSAATGNELAEWNLNSQKD